MKSKRKILLAESNRDDLRAMARLFHENGYLVFKAITGKGALRIVSQVKPDVVVLARVLPDADTVFLTRAIKLNPTLPDTKVFIYYNGNKSLPWTAEQRKRLVIDGHLPSVGEEMVAIIDNSFASPL